MILALALGGMLSAQAQHVQESNFCSPFDFPILLSANFGELRPNHSPCIRADRKRREHRSF